MIIFKNCCFIYSLKSGCIIIAYFYILQGYFNILVAFLVQENGCPGLSRYWFLQSQIGIIAGVILLAGCFNVRAIMLWVSVKCKNYINDPNMLERECDSTVSLTYFCETDEPDCRVHVLPSDGGKWLYVYPIEDIFFCLASGWVAVFILFSFTYVHSHVPQLPSTLSFWRSRISKWQLRKREREGERLCLSWLKTVVGLPHRLGQT